MEPMSRNQLQFEIYQELGECYTHTGDIQSALEHFLTAQKLDPASERPFVGLGVAVLQRQEFEKAQVYFQKALGLNAGSCKALTGLALALSSTGRHEEGFKKYQEALDIQPDNLTALMGALQAAYELQQLDVAVHYLRRYLDLYPGNVKILYCLAGTYFKQRRYSDAHDTLEQLFIFEPEHADGRELARSIERQQQDGVHGQCQNF